MATQVRDTAAGKSVSAWVVLNKKGQHVATVNAHFGSNNCRVDVWNIGESATFNSWKAAIKSGKLSAAAVSKALAECSNKRDWLKENERAEWAAFDIFGLLQSSGNNLDSALEGLVIDGQYLFDHCGKDSQTEKLLTKYQSARDAFSQQWLIKDFQKVWDEKANKIGAHFANYQTGKGYGSLFMYGGLRRLQELGYAVCRNLATP